MCLIIWRRFLLEQVSNYFTMKITQLSDPGVSEILQSIQLGCVDFPKEQLKVKLALI
jgi:hypothetical protein